MNCPLRNVSLNLGLRLPRTGIGIIRITTSWHHKVIRSHVNTSWIRGSHYPNVASCIHIMQVILHPSRFFIFIFIFNISKNIINQGKIKGERFRTIYRIKRKDSIRKKRDIYEPILIIVSCLTTHNIMG